MNISSRIIPARAGQTTLKLCRVPWDADHPRACGANGGSRRALPGHSGSSPRVRGKRAQAVQDRETVRIIPARAGQTWCLFHFAFGGSDHPRACGANPVLFSIEGIIVGSSPRVRGKRVVPERVNEIVRIIPARAGQTCTPALRPRRRPDHPRACGANFGHPSADGVAVGSSPRVRGKLGRSLFS